MTIIEVPHDKQRQVARVLPGIAHLLDVDLCVLGHLPERVFIDLERYLSDHNGSVFSMGLWNDILIEVCLIVLHFPSWAPYVSAYLKNTLTWFRLVLASDPVIGRHYVSSLCRRSEIRAQKTWIEMIQHKRALLNEMCPVGIPIRVWNICLEYWDSFADINIITGFPYLEEWEENLTSGKRASVRRILADPLVFDRVARIPVVSYDACEMIQFRFRQDSDSDAEEPNYSDSESDFCLFEVQYGTFSFAP